MLGLLLELVLRVASQVNVDLGILVDRAGLVVGGAILLCIRLVRALVCDRIFTWCLFGASKGVLSGDLAVRAIAFGATLAASFNQPLIDDALDLLGGLAASLLHQ